MTIKINDKEFKSKEDAIRHIEGLNEIIVVRIYAYPDLNEGKHGPLLKDEYYFKAHHKVGGFVLEKQITPIIAELRNTLIKIYGAEYDYVMGSKSNPVKLWDVKVERMLSDDKNTKDLDIEKLIEDVKESFKDKLY